ncbi:MAG: hypothetical protein NBV76_08535 [Candidatus Ochrobactrum gambitense]|nr:MAG: hypothetical protein NBV76_08535 [Candidatus Ochrobactrum gambitense]WEK16619.1 MAG: hypothetical protein P0Y54_02425 [Candidatus Ochrobactrum gambitense]
MKKYALLLVPLFAASGSALADTKTFEECVRNEQAAATEAYKQAVQDGHGAWFYASYIRRFNNAKAFCSKQ